MIQKNQKISKDLVQPSERNEFETLTTVKLLILSRINRSGSFSFQLIRSGLVAGSSENRVERAMCQFLITFLLQK